VILLRTVLGVRKETGTFSDSRFETSADKARREPTKYILMSVIARVMHCWNRNR
jgi:hypothetical protein